MTITAVEREVKLDVPEGWAMPDLGGVPGVTEVRDVGTHRLVATYHDTADHRLLAARATLRRRTGGTDAGWHLKLPSGPSGGERLEVRREHRRPPRTVPAEFVALARSRSRGEKLAPVVELVTERHAYHLVRGDVVLVEVVDDRVTARTSDGGAQSWREVEAELVDGDVTLLDAVVGVLMGAGATPAAGPSKLGRALGRPAAARAPVRDPRSVGGLTLGYLRAQVDVLVDGDARVRLDLPDAVHAMRVATRRLRSTLATHRRLIDHDLVVHLRAELRHLAAVLGAARDAEVLRERILADLATLPAEVVDPAGAPGAVEALVAAALDADVAAARDALLAELDSERHRALLDAIEDLVHGSGLPDPTSERPVARGRRASVRHDLRRVRRALDVAAAVRGTPELPAALHEVRKSAKRTRYAAELVAPVIGDRALLLVERLTAVQDLLGAHQDDVVVRERLRRLAVVSAGAAWPAGTGGSDGTGRADRADVPRESPAFALGVLHERATGSDEVAYLAARRLVRDARRHWPA